MILKIAGAAAAVAVSSLLFDVPYIASDGSIHLCKETPEEYRQRHAELARARRMRRSSGPYTASDGRVYAHKETPAEYRRRRRLSVM